MTFLLYGCILLENSVFSKLGAFWRNTVPQTSHSANIVCTLAFTKHLILRSGNVFLAREFFNRMGGKRKFAAVASVKCGLRKAAIPARKH